MSSVADDLKKEFGSTYLKLEDVAAKYLALEPKTANNKAASNDLPFPVFRLSGNKSPWLISPKDFADYVEKTAIQARQAYRV